jgi:hypothetical protein
LLQKHEILHVDAQVCGRIRHFKRATDPVSGAEKAFGFAEFESAEGVLNAVRVLHDMSLFNENLVVKVDSKTQAYLDRYQQAKRAHLKTLGTEITPEKEQREKNLMELHARQILNEQLDRRQMLIARMPRPGHADGRRATPEPEDIQPDKPLIPEQIADMDDAAVHKELDRLRYEQEKRGRKLASQPPSVPHTSSSGRANHHRRMQNINETTTFVTKCSRGFSILLRL